MSTGSWYPWTCSILVSTGHSSCRHAFDTFYTYPPHNPECQQDDTVQVFDAFIFLPHTLLYAMRAKNLF